MCENAGLQPTDKPGEAQREALECLDVVIEDQVVEAVPLQQRLRVLQVEVLELEHSLRLVWGHMSNVRCSVECA